MRNDLTDITVVMDHSGSMRRCRKDSEGGINSFIDEQKRFPGSANFTLLQFDHEVQYVHRAEPIQLVPNVLLVPRGFTALLDAIGRAVTDTGARLEALPEDERPGLVIVVIVTDGGENASMDFTKEQVKELIEQQQNVYSWKFIFLGANQDAFWEAGSIGIAQNFTSNYNIQNTGLAYQSTSNVIGLMRSATSRGLGVGDLSYSDQDRKAMSA